MTLGELKTLLDATEYPVSYSHFDDEVTPPYITYLVTGSSNMIADNHVYQKIDNVRVELYTNYKDLQAEKAIEDLLVQNDIPYESTETFIDSERLFQKVYEIGVI
ncbi:hypothetical protein [Tuberibacillus sp. Marseille-P3662]|uniref:hypothetical protein n=1 Tax=Tuberibacillus sp. Marseille-P3662 TaxID=1965358 RepID=UPI000A1CED2B|nr:hypothetical protein [Tuberibacillus sp. Marseille-P3662]